MEINKKIKETKTVSVTVDILCNQCGKTCNNAKRKGMEDKIHVEYSGLIETEVHGGYHSEKVGDMVSWKFSLCEFCLDKMVSKFKIPIQIKDNDLTGEYLSPTEIGKLRKKSEKKNQEEWIKAIIEKAKANNKSTKDFKKKLASKTSKELYDFFHSL